MMSCIDDADEEIVDIPEDKCSKNIRQYETRIALEARLEEKRLRKLFDFEEYAFDDEDHEWRNDNIPSSE